MTDRDRSLDIRAMELLEEALDRPSGEREDWIARAAADNPELRDRALSLLRAERSASASVRTGGAPEADPADDPERIGAYRILGTLGRGGMGAVYLGERATGDFEHKVAIKVIKPGALSESLIERFQRERQILATLGHPNIARLFDGGETEAGEPYIVMEHVDGGPLSTWLEEGTPSLDARLALFLQICAAVSFAHQSLVVHRDLTPSNVLVTRAGQAKLIDFGISRPTEDAGVARREGGSLTNLSLTPGYAAPERESGAVATTLSDIFSLGKILDALVGEQRNADLAAIIAKACAEDPARRYPSADALADDVERFRTGLPVPARGRGRSYVLSKFVRRHRPGVAAAAGAIALILAALVVALLSFANAERARAAEAERFDQVRSLAGYMLFDLNDALSRVPGNTEARVRLAEEAQRYLSALAATPDAEPRLRLETARGLIRLAAIQGVPLGPNFGERELAKSNLDTADAILDGLARSGVAQALLAPDRAQVDAYRAIVLVLGDQEIPAGQAALASARRHLGGVAPDARSPQWHSARSLFRRAQAEIAYLEGDDVMLDRTSRRMYAEITQWPSAMRRSRAAAEERAFAIFYRACAQSMLTDGDFGIPAMLAAERALASLDARWPNDPFTLYSLTWNDYQLFAAAARAERQAESTRAIGNARARIDRLLAIESNDNALDTLDSNIEEAYAQDLANRGLFREAIAAQRAVVAQVSLPLTPARRPSTLSAIAWAEMMLGGIARKAGDRALACSSWDRADALFAEIEREGELTGFHAGFMPGLRANTRRCEEGLPVSQFGPLA